MTDPLDKQLVEVALSGGGRRKSDIEEAKLAGIRPRRDEESLEDDDSDDEEIIVPVDADDDSGVGGITPFAIGDAMKSMGTETQEMARARRGHGG